MSRRGGSDGLPPRYRGVIGDRRPVRRGQFLGMVDIIAGEAWLRRLPYEFRSGYTSAVLIEP